MFYKAAVSQELLETAQSLSALPELDSFRMVGGTAIALQIGHRKSIDIDLYNPLLSPKSILFALEEVNTAEKNKSVMPEMLATFSWKEVKKSMHGAAKAYLAMQPKTKST